MIPDRGRTHRGPSAHPLGRVVVAAVMAAWVVLAACFGAACGSNAQKTNADASANPDATDDGSGMAEAGGDGAPDASVSDAADTSVGDAPDGCPFLDAEVPSTQSDAGCGLRLVSCAAACGFTPADVACEASSDCTQYTIYSGCGCSGTVVGVNTTSTVQCPRRYCPPPPNDTCSFRTERCDVVYDASSIGVVCVDHQCVTYAVAVGSDG